MKLKALGLALLVAGFGASYAFAKNSPPQHGHSKLAVCHKAGKSGRWVKISVPTKAAEKAHLKHGDVLPDAAGACPGTPDVTTTATTTTSDETTTAETTTEQTTTEDDQGDDQGDDSQGDDSQ